MDTTETPPTVAAGEISTHFLCSQQLVGGVLIVELTSLSQLRVDNIRITISHYNASDTYLDFSELKLDPFKPHESREIRFEPDMPDDTVHSIVDIDAIEQTWLKRNWPAITLVVAVTWGIIVLSRRLA